MPSPYQLLAAHPALDFINTLDNRFRATAPVELMPTYDDLLNFAAQTELLSSRQLARCRKDIETKVAAQGLTEAHALRETLAAVFYAIAEREPPPPKALHDLQQVVLEASAHQDLIAAGRAGTVAQIRWQFAENTPLLELPIWTIALSALQLLTSDQLGAIRECASTTCRWLFLDTTKNHSRRWCDMAICGNRQKARQFIARRKSSRTKSSVSRSS